MSGGYLARGVIVQRVYVRGVFVLIPLKGPKLSPSLLRFYIADMPRRTDPVSGSATLTI